MADIFRTKTVITGPMITGGGLCQLYYLTNTTTPTLACQISNALWNSMAALFQTGTTFATLADVDRLDEATGQINAVVAGTALSTNGSGGTEPLPAATQGLISWRTGVFSDGREIRGRTFLPGMIEGSSTAGIPTAGYHTVVNAAISNVLSTVGGESAVWRRPRLARPQVGQPGDPWYLPAQTARQGVAAAITTGTSSPKWAVLRGRRD